MGSSASKPSSNAVSKKRKRPAGPSGTTGQDVGGALRSVYDATLQESIPQEMLDLLGKLD